MFCSDLRCLFILPHCLQEVRHFKENIRQEIDQPVCFINLQHDFRLTGFESLAQFRSGVLASRDTSSCKQGVHGDQLIVGGGGKGSVGFDLTENRFASQIDHCIEQGGRQTGSVFGGGGHLDTHVASLDKGVHVVHGHAMNGFNHNPIIGNFFLVLFTELVRGKKFHNRGNALQTIQQVLCFLTLTNDDNSHWEVVQDAVGQQVNITFLPDVKALALWNLDGSFLVPVD